MEKKRRGKSPQSFFEAKRLLSEITDTRNLPCYKNENILPESAAEQEKCLCKIDLGDDPRYSSWHVEVQDFWWQWRCGKHCLGAVEPLFQLQKLCKHRLGVESSDCVFLKLRHVVAEIFHVSCSKLTPILSTCTLDRKNVVEDFLNSKGFQQIPTAWNFAVSLNFELSHL